MADNQVVVGGGRATAFVAGAVVVAAIIGAILYASGYFDNREKIELQVEVPKIELDGN